MTVWSVEVYVLFRNNNTVFVSAINTKNEDVKLHCKSVLAKVSVTVDESEREDRILVLDLGNEIDDLEAHIADKINKYDFDDLNDKETLKFKNLLFEHKNVISVSEYDVGSVRDFEHTINLEKNDPVNTPQWRISESTKEIIELHVSKMLKAGIIELLSSLWCSPVIMVKKKHILAILIMHLCEDLR